MYFESHKTGDSSRSPPLFFFSLFPDPSATVGHALTDTPAHSMLSVMRYLILQADDFGLTPGITDGILEAHSQGLLTSTSLLIGAADAPRAARLAREHSRLGVGLHLTLSHARPQLSARRIPTLVGPDGHFPDNPAQVLQHLNAGLLNPIELKAELEAQILATRDLGLTITHIDSHNHLHLHPAVLPTVLELMSIHQITALRLPRPSPFPSPGPTDAPPSRAQSLQAFLNSLPLGELLATLRSAGKLTTDHFFGLEQAGRISVEFLLKCLDSLPDGTTELMVHPGHLDPLLRERHPWDYQWEEALAALLDPQVAASIRRGQIELIHFGDLPLIRQDV